MIGKILGGLAGAQAAEHTKNLSGPGGAILGAAAVALARRLSLPALIALTAGGYALKKLGEKKEPAAKAPRPARAAATPA